MHRTAIRIFVAIAGAAGLLLVPAARAGAATASSAPATSTPATSGLVLFSQSFTGTATGAVTEVLDGQLPFKGDYTSTGQLGLGRLVTVDRFISTTAVQFTRSDGATLSGNAHKTNECGPPVAFVWCWSVDLTGTSDVVSAHVAMAVKMPVFRGGIGGPGAASISMHGTLTMHDRIGYVLLDSDGHAHAFGGIDHAGDGPDHTPTADVALTPMGEGYWIVDPLGHVAAFGNAVVLGNGRAPTLDVGEIVTSISATPSGNGYWLFTDKGRVLPYGDAQSFGDLLSMPLNGRIVDSIATPTGLGYYMVGADGGVFAFGDARFRGSMGGARLNAPVVGLVPSPDNSGYWLVAADGGVFSFHATFYGSMGATPLNARIAAMIPYGQRYLMIGSDGGDFNFSLAPYFGNATATGASDPVVAAAGIG